MDLAQLSLRRYAGSGLLALHFTPEELFFGFGQRRGRVYRVSALDSIDIRPFVLEGGEYDVLALSQAIQQALKDHHIRVRRAAVSFPVKFPWIRVLDVPNVSEKDLARIVRLEVERLYLDSTVEKLIDYFPLEPTRDRSAGGTTAVLSVAIPRNSVAPYVEVATASKLELVGIDLAEVNVLKLAAMQGVDFGEGITLILNLNMESTDLMLMEDNKLQIVRKVGQGKQHLRQVLDRNLPADSSLRRDLARVDFTLPSEHVRLAADYVHALLGEIRRSIEFYLTEIKRAEGSVSKVILAGSGYWPTNLPEILALQLHLPLIDLSMERMPMLECHSTHGPGFPLLGVFAPVVGGVLRGVA